MTRLLNINQKMTMKEIIQLNPKTKEILAPFHIGVCPSCVFDENDTLEKVANQNGAPVSLLLQLLNETRVEEG